MNSKLANEIFRYDPDTGKLFWRISPNSRAAVGDEIKSKHRSGYLIVTYNGKSYPAHRIIWCMTYGKMPDGQIDHIDHVRTNNRLENLRDVSPSSNQRNQSISTRNTSGFLGVSFNKNAKKWRAAGKRSDGIEKHIGYFDKIEDAVEARKAFNRENGYHINHGK